MFINFNFDTSRLWGINYSEKSARAKFHQKHEHTHTHTYVSNRLGAYSTGQALPGQATFTQRQERTFQSTSTVRQSDRSIVALDRQRAWPHNRAAASTLITLSHDFLAYESIIAKEIRCASW